MIVTENLSELDVRSERQSDLCVERTDISFHDVPGDKVRVQVTVHNTGFRTSPPTPMLLESAPLGAFVPWQPLARLLVPALEPGESRELSIDVARPRPTPLGDFDRVPPGRLLTAVNSPDESSDQPSPPPSGLGSILNLLRRPSARPAGKAGAPRKNLLAPDLWDLVGRGQTHWAGNINVFIGRKPVERHMARALRIFPGRANLAMFLIGEPRRPDAYSFELVGLAPDWNATLYDATTSRTLVPAPSQAPIEETKWVESNSGLMVMLAIHPPADSEAGNLEVHVTRRSSGETAIVEFDLDPSAQGAGCYYL